MRRETWDIFSRKSVTDHNVFPGTWYFKCKSKPDWKIGKFKARYCVREDVQKRMSQDPPNLYYPVLQRATVMLMLILQCTIGLHSQSIDFKNDFSQSDITSGESVLIELPRDFNSDGGQCDVVLRLKKSIYGQAEATRLWYEKFQNGLLDCGFVMIKVDPCMFMSKTVICVVYVDDCMFRAHSQYEIDNVMKSFKGDGTSYNREQ